MNREEIVRIEMTDEEWIASRTRRTMPAQVTCFDQCAPITLKPEIEKRTDEPQKNEVAKKKPVKIHKRANKTAMARVQKKS